MKVNNRRKRKITDFICRGLIYLSTGLTVAILFVILGFVLYKGLPGINIRFLTRQWDDKTTIVKVTADANANEKNGNLSDENYVSSMGITIGMKNDEIVIRKIDKNSPVKEAANLKNKEYALKTHDVISKVDDVKLEDISVSEAAKVLNSITADSKIKVTRPGGGILPMLISTVYIIIISLCIAAPIGICSAIYLNEYAKPGRVLRLIRFAIQNLAGIPSIIYGLFGMLVFVRLLKMEYSILAGSLTLSILLLPTIISTTEEALKEIPKAYRESSYGLGATKLQTISKIILPGALPGILVAVILSIGRIVGESAALIWTAGTVAQIPKALVGSKAGAATLTTKLYWVIKETGNLEEACSIAIVLIALIITLNIISKLITKRFLKKRGNN
jgi:phosphate transport system permease protein